MEMTATVFRYARGLPRLCSTVIGAELTVKEIRVPLDVHRSQVRSLQWLPLLLTPSSIGCIPGLLEFLHTAMDFQSHTYFQLPCLVDIKPFYSTMKRVYSRTFVQYDVASKLHNTPLLFGIWHAYKYCAIVMYRCYMPILALLEKPSIRTEQEPTFRTKPHLHHIEVVFASLLVHAASVKGPLLATLERTVEGTQAHHILSALNVLLYQHIPTLFSIGVHVRDCLWDGRDNGSGRYYKDALFYSFILLLVLTREAAYKVEYVRGIAISLLVTGTWHTNKPGSIYNEEKCEAMLSRLAKLIHRYPTHTSADALMDLFLTVRPGSSGYKDKNASRIPPTFLDSMGRQLSVLINQCTTESMPFSRWTSSDNFTNVESDWDLGYRFPLTIEDVVNDETWVHDVLTRSLIVLTSATSPQDQHMDLMSDMFPDTDSETLRERREHLRHLGRIGLPDRFKANQANVDVAPVYVVEHAEERNRVPANGDCEVIVSSSSESDD